MYVESLSDLVATGTRRELPPSVDTLTRGILRRSPTTLLGTTNGSLGQGFDVARLSAQTGLDQEFVGDFLYAYNTLSRPRFPGVIDPRGIPFVQASAGRAGVAWLLKEYVLPGFGIYEGITGKDLLTSRELTTLERVLGIVGDAFSFLPIGRVARPALRFFGRGVRLASRGVKLAGRIVGRGAARWATAAVQLGVPPSRMLGYLGRISRLPSEQVVALRTRVKQARAAGVALRLTPAERRLIQEISNAGRELRGQAPSRRVLGPPASAAPAAVSARAALARIASRANTARAILSVLNTRVFWRSGPHRVYVTSAGQLVGTHAALRRFAETYRRAGRRIYARWHSHHIVEEVHLRNLGVRHHFPSRDALPAVLLPSAGHSQRLRSLLGPADTLRLTPQQLLADHYQQAYRLLGAYTGMGSERQIAAELSAVAGRMLGLR